MKRFTTLVCLLLSFFSLKAADDYYWVGGGGRWSDVNHWRIGSFNGSIPGIIPSAANNVIFGPDSGFGDNDSVKLDANAFCANMIWTTDVPKNPLFIRQGGSTLTITESLSLAPSVTCEGIMVTFTTGSAATLTTNGPVLGSIGFDINKPGGSFTLADDLIYNAPASGGNTITLTAGTFNAPGRKISAYTFATSSALARSIDISNTEMNIYLGYNCQGANKTLNAAGSVIKTGRFYSDAGLYNIVESGANLFTHVTIVNTTFKKLTFTNTSTVSEVGINSGNTIDTLIFKGSGAVRANSNNVNYISCQGAATIGGSGNYLKYVTVLNGPLGIASGGNTFDTLLTTPNRNISIAGTTTINKHFRAGGAPCNGFTELTGTSTGTLAFGVGATASIDNVLLTNVTATGSIAPITLNGIDGEGNSGFIINSPSVAGTTLYWVNGAGDWNDNSHWSTSSGGPGGACIPFIRDNVVFDINSGFVTGSNTVTTSANTYCNNMTWASGVTGSPTFNESIAFVMQIYGSVVLEPTVTMNAFVDMRGTSAAMLTTNGSTLGVSQYTVWKDAGSPGAGLTLLDNWTNAGSGFVVARGALNLSGRTVNIYAITSTGSLARSIDISNARISVSNWNYTGSLFTLNATNSYLLARLLLATRAATYNVVDCDATVAGNMDVSTTTFGQLTFTNNGLTSAARINTGNIIRKLEFKGQGMILGTGNMMDSLVTAENRNFFFYNVGTGNTTTINKYYKATHPSCSGLGEVRSGTTAISTVNFGPNAKVDIANVYLVNIAATGGGGTLTLPIAFSGADAGGNSGWTIGSSTGSARYWINGSGDWNDASHWSTTSNGVGGACVPTVTDDVYFDANSGFTAASKTVTINNGNAYFHNVSWAGAANDPVFTKNNAWTMECWGNSIVLNPASTLNISTLLLKGTEQTVMTGQCKGSFDLEINKPGSGLTLANDYTNTLTRFFLVDGNFTASGKVLNIASIDNAGRDNQIALDISGSTIKGDIRYYGTTTKRTLNAANSNITGAVTLNGFTYNIITVPGMVAANATISNTTVKSLVFTDPATTSAAGINGTNNTIGYVEYKGSGGIYGTGNTIDTLIFFPGDIYTFAGGSNTTIRHEWFGSGTPCRLTEIKSSNATNATITKPAGSVEFDYIRLQRITGTGGASFSIKQHSTDQGGNIGWTVVPYNGSSPIQGLGDDVEICSTAFPYELNTQGFFGSPSSQYLWNDNSTKDKLIANGPGKYYVRVSFPDGCSVSDTINIKQTVVPVSPITGTTAVCLGFNTTLSSTTTGGVWSSSDAAVASIDAAGVVTGVTIGTATITYTITNGGGCSNSQTVTVTVSSLPVVAAITGTGDVCIDGTTTLSSTTTGGVWSSSDAAVASVDASGIVTGVTAGSATITYTVTNVSGCKASQIMNVTVNGLPVVAAITGTGTVCIDETTTLSSTTTGGVWSSSNAAVASVDASGVVTGVTAGSATITYTVTNASGCEASQVMNVTVNGLPVVAAITGTGTVCVDGTTTLSSTTTGGVWSSSDAAVASVDASGVVTGVTTGSATITYTVTNVSGCKASQVMNVTVNGLPVVAAITGTGTVCVDGTTTLSSTTTGGVWSSSDAAVASIDAAGVVTGVTTGTATITYTITNGGGCSNSQTVTVTVSSLPVVAAITGTGTVCIDETTTLSSTTTGGIWSSSDAAVASVDAAGIVTGVTAGSATITYTVTNVSGCKASQVMNVTVNGLPVVAAITGTGTVCIDGTTTLSSTTTGGVWSSSNAAIASVDASGVVTGVTAGSATITYTVTNVSGCKASQIMNVTVNGLPVVAAITGTGDVCIDETTTLSSTTTGGVWSSSDAAVASVDVAGVVTGVTAGSATITYTVTNVSGCEASQIMNITVNGLPVVAAITGTGDVCIDETTTLSSTTTGGVWSSSDAAIASVDASGVVTGVTAGSATITYTVTNASGCKASQVMTVTVNGLPVVAAITGTGDVCIDGTTTLSSTTTGGVWSSSDAAVASVDASGVVTGITAGSAIITYTVTNASGCKASQIMNVTVNGLPVVAAITGTGDVCIDETTTLSSTTTGGVWSSSDAAVASVDASGIVTGVTAGSATITYTVTNASGCKASQIMTITINGLPVVAAITGTGDVCIDETTTLSSTTTGGVWSSSDAAVASVDASGIVTGVTAGSATITYTVTNVSGCKASQIMNVTVSSLPVVAAITGTGDVCIDETTTLSSTTTGGVWSSSDAAVASVDASGIVTGVTAGSATITYTVTNVSGCKTSQIMNVTVSGLPVVAAITGTGDVCIDETTTLSSTTTGGVWSSSDAAIASVDASGVVTGVTVGSATITYTVTNVSGCKALQVMNVTVNGLPVVAAITGTGTVCIDGTTTLSSTTTGGVWSSSDGAVASVDASGIVTGVTAGSATITYTVTNVSGCKTSQIMNVTVSGLPVVAAITGTGDVCIDETTTLSSTTTGGVWSSSDAAIASVDASGVVTGVTVGSATITYTVTNVSGCKALQVMNVTVNGLPVVAAITGTGTVCIDGTTTLSSTTTGGVWSSSDGAVASVDASGIVTGVTAGSATITYTVTNVSGCKASQIMNVTVSSLPVVAAITGTGTVCIDGTTTLSSTTTGGVWSSSDAAVASVDASGIVTGVTAGSATITYTVTNASGCKASQIMNVTVSGLPVVAAITGTGTVCIDGTTTLSSTTTGGVWSSSDAAVASVDASGIVTGVTAGSATITYTVTNVNGCKASQIMTITVNGLPVVAAITGTGTVCVDGTTTLSSTTTGGVWSSSDAAVASVDAAGVVTGVTAGNATITYTVTNMSGCSSSKVINITVNKCNNQQPPVANNDVATTFVNIPVLINLIANDVQTGGLLDLSSVIIVSQPSKGTISINANGTVTYSPVTAFIGTDIFSYTIRNTRNDVSNPATVTVTVKPLPGAVNDTAQTLPGREVVVSVLDNDTGLTGFADIIITTRPARGTLRIDADGKIIYMPDAGFKGVDVFAYQVKDLAGNISNEAIVRITVTEDGFFIPNAITPNNDGINDRFVIPDLYKYPGSSLSIFNRWGNEVYYSGNYNNNWDGNGLGGGTYYYVLKLKIPEGAKAYKGWIQLLK
ncbi:Ig-like domain-containing protein [Chitinophaga sp. MM2321]|uniref:Ig-like domain-containing protein n=1 Tax=Chitinophaga sp. MM2321 TaxID=3137178 RepID=UPI0032D57013